VLIQNHKDFTKYCAGLIRINKYVSTNTIHAISLGKSLNDRYTFNEAKALLAQNINFHRNAKSNMRIDYIITDTSNINLNDVTIIKRDAFNIKEEDRLLRDYMSSYDKIAKGKCPKTPQKLQLGNGIILLEGEKNKIKLDLNYAYSHTIAIMHAIDIALKNKSAQMLTYL
jgi:hypothetical protein